MSSSMRMLIVVLLSLALPLQASLAYARAVSMAACRPAGVAKGMETDTKRAVVTEAQHADDSQEQASHAEHHHSARNPASSATEPVIKNTNHHAPHASSAKTCDNCAKCCLAGAAAPPLIWPHTAQMVVASVLFSSISDKLSCFVPDGPERPPRCF